MSDEITKRTKAKAYLMNIKYIADWLSPARSLINIHEQRLRHSRVMLQERRRNFRVMESCQQFRWRRINL